MPLTFAKKTIPSIVTFRPEEDVAKMLERALQDHPVMTKVVNECIRRQLSANGYSRKREKTA